MNTKHELAEDWTHISPGDRVTVLMPDKREILATVDDKTENSKIVWVIPDGDLRRAYNNREGVLMMRH